VRNHGFVDGNKRTATVAMIAFLRVNGFILAMPNDTSLGHMVEALIERRLSEDELGDALFGYVVPV
jgi:death on curing protein